MAKLGIALIPSVLPLAIIVLIISNMETALGGTDPHHDPQQMTTGNVN